MSVVVRTHAGAVSGAAAAATAAQFTSERLAHSQRMNADTVNRELP